jgi:hypothetical protein
MPNITLSVDEETIKKVRKIAVDQNTTLTAMIRDFLVSVARRTAPERERAVRSLEASFAKFSRDMGPRSWRREDLHER